MTKEIILAIDAMGGDKGPVMTVAGTAIAAKRFPEARFLMFGKNQVLRPLIAQYKCLQDRVEIRHTSDVVEMEDKPSQAIRTGRNSSMGLAVRAVKEGEADVAISAGNTGALMALAKITLRTMPGISRPALATILPALKRDVVMLDLGANVDCDEKNLVQFAIMGAAFSRTVLHLTLPQVALLNVGVEELKGSDSVKKAAKILKEANLPMQFEGFLEGDSIGVGDVDVVVTDGFTGNIAVKTAEGTAKLIAELLRRAFYRNLITKIGFLFAKGGLDWIRKHLDPNTHNGAVFLGLNGLVVKSHGSSSASGYAEAIQVAVEMRRNNIIELITEDLKNFSGGETETLTPALKE
ncbi:MAG: phosphate acyltransferase PlsX [Proteobacteria bacterium]|nr:phosphate acyltransferase PlsX [Pseudomonadota bacterium]